MICPDCHHRPSMRQGNPGLPRAYECECPCHDAADAGPRLLEVCEVAAGYVHALPDRFTDRERMFNILQAAIALAKEPTPC